jgi:hypothetical protein
MFTDGTAKTITVVVDSAATTTESDVTMHFVEYSDTATTPHESDAVTNGTTPVTVLLAPAVGVQRHVNFVSIYNADTVAHTYTVRLVNGAASRRVITMNLAPGRTVQYTQNNGWQYVPAETPTHQSVSANITAQNTYTTPILVQAGDAVSVSVAGSGWVAGVALERMLDGISYNAVPYAAGVSEINVPAQMTYLADETGYLRIGCATGKFTSGTIPVRLGVN